MIQPLKQTSQNSKLWLLVALFYAVLVVVFCYPILQGMVITQTDYLHFISPWDALKPAELLSPGNPYLQDQSTEFLPFFLEAKRQFAEGMFPLWNPYIFAGNPLWANTQSALLFPLNLFHYLLEAPLGFTVSSMFKLFFGCLLTHLYVRKLGISHGPALLAGVAFGFCSFTVFWLNHPHTNVTPLIPLSFYMVERLLDKADGRNMMLYALVVALTLIAGHVEIAFLTATGCGLYYLLRLWQLNQLRFSPLLKFFGIYVFALLLSAILVFPFIEFLFNTAIWSERGDAVKFSIPTTGLINLLMGEFFIFAGWDPNNIGYHAFSAYIGLAALPLALFAVLKSFKSTMPLLVVCLLSVAVGFSIDPFNWLVKQLPLFNHLPLFYFNVLTAFGISVLAAMGLQQCLQQNRDKPKLFGLLVLLLLTSLMIRIFWVPGGLTPYVADAELLVAAVHDWIKWVALGMLGVWLLMYFSRKIHATIVIGLLVGLIYADLWRLGHDWNPSIKPAFAVPKEQPGSLAFLAEQTEPFRTVGYDGVMIPSTNMLAQVRDVRGYDVPVIDRYHQFFNRALNGKDAFWFYNLPNYDAAILPFLNILNARYMLAKKPLDSLPAFIKPVYQKEIYIYQNQQAMGHAYVRTTADFQPTPTAALDRVIELAAKLSDVVVIEAAGQDRVVKEASEPSSVNHDITYQQVKADAIALQVSGDQAGWLVLSQSFYPGWHAYINGEETDIFAANYVLQAIKIPPGSHQITFKYQPFSFTLGWVVSLLSLIFALWIIRKTK